jgi:hypothetical protein
MPQPWMPGLRHDPGLNANYRRGRNTMRMPVWHWTVGRDSYGICKNQGLCHILLPKVGVPWQFAEIDALCFHAYHETYGKYNDDGPGMEEERFPDEPLTPDQILWSGRIVEWLDKEWGVPPVHYWGPRFAWNQANFHGHVNHADLHPNNDGVSQSEWVAIAAPAAPTPTKKDDDPMLYVFNPHASSEIWCFAGNSRRHVTPDEWAFVQFVGGKAIKVSKAWFDSYPVAA